jgi:hypothetical protein
MFEDNKTKQKISSHCSVSHIFFILLTNFNDGSKLEQISRKQKHLKDKISK